MKNIKAFCLDWHKQKSSSAFDLLSEPLKKFIKAELTPWDGVDFNYSLKEFDRPVIFYMIPPPWEILEKFRKKIIWIPMWDQARGYSDKWWQRLPKEIKIVSFSREIEKKCQRHNLKYLQVKFFLNPDQFSRANWNDGRILFYWNRTDLFSSGFLSQLCQNLDINKIILLDSMDPAFESLFSKKIKYLKKKNSSLEIDYLPRHSSKKQYMALLNQSNIVIAPRLYEGVGFSFLEAMVKGCTVFAADNATMSEYINHAENGYLFDSRKNLYRGRKIIKRIVARFRLKRLHFGEQLTAGQEWQQIKSLNLRKIGNRARSDHANGYSNWVKSIDSYYSFVSEN